MEGVLSMHVDMMDLVLSLPLGSMDVFEHFRQMGLALLVVLLEAVS